MANSKLVVVITGAAGHVGEALLYRVASGEMFGKNVRLELRLLELERAMPTLHGIHMELDDCAFPLVDKVVCTTDIKEAMLNANWVFMVGAAARTTGMERSALLKLNCGIFSKQGKAINDYASDDVRVLVVGNPCNTNALVAMTHAPDVPNDRFYAMTMLDELRARSLIAKKSGHLVSEVSNLVIWGNHSATQYPDFYNTKINKQKLTDVIKDEKWLQDDFIVTVQKRGVAILKARGVTSAASAANAIIRAVQNLTTPTSDNDCFSLGVCSRGEYGISEGLIFSFPHQVKEGKLLVVENVIHNDFAKNRIALTLQELKQEKEVVKNLGLIK